MKRGFAVLTLVLASCGSKANVPPMQIIDKPIPVNKELVFTDRVALAKAIPCWDELNAPRQNVLRDMRFNLGHAGLMGFKNTLYKLCRGDYDGAAKGIESSRYCKQVKRRCVRNAYTLRYGRYHPDYLKLFKRGA